MPTYEYECTACGDRFDIVRSIKDPPLRKCGKCGGRLEKVFHAPAIMFRGSGFHVTDYGKHGPKERESKPPTESKKASVKKKKAAAKTD
jgi:putative FmdB family regulatory protein